MQEITAASDEQSTGVGQINTAMSQLTQLTQQNAAGSEELAATAEEMTGQAERLRSIISFFQVGGSEDFGAVGAPTRGVTHAAASPAARKAHASDAGVDGMKFRRMQAGH